MEVVEVVVEAVDLVEEPLQMDSMDSSRRQIEVEVVGFLVILVEVGGGERQMVLVEVDLALLDLVG